MISHSVFPEKKNILKNKGVKIIGDGILCEYGLKVRMVKYGGIDSGHE